MNLVLRENILWREVIINLLFGHELLNICDKVGDVTLKKNRGRQFGAPMVCPTEKSYLRCFVVTKQNFGFVNFQTSARVKL